MASPALELRPEHTAPHETAYSYSDITLKFAGGQFGLIEIGKDHPGFAQVSAQFVSGGHVDSLWDRITFFRPGSFLVIFDEINQARLVIESGTREFWKLDFKRGEGENVHVGDRPYLRARRFGRNDSNRVFVEGRTGYHPFEDWHIGLPGLDLDACLPSEAPPWEPGSLTLTQSGADISLLAKQGEPIVPPHSAE